MIGTSTELVVCFRESPAQEIERQEEQTIGCCMGKANKDPDARCKKVEGQEEPREKIHYQDKQQPKVTKLRLA